MRLTDEERAVIKPRLVEAKADAFVKRAAAQNVLDLIYRAPESAYVSIMKAFSRSDEGTLLRQLKDDPAQFGALQAQLEVARRGPWPLSARQELTKNLIQRLGDALKAVYAAEQAVQDLQRAYHGPVASKVYYGRDLNRVRFDR